MEASGKQAAGCLAGYKRPRGGYVDVVPSDAVKRAKLDQGTGADFRPTSTDKITSKTSKKATTESKADISPPPDLQKQASKLPEPQLPAEVQHLRQKLDFSTMSILSSSKIESRVRNLLERVGRSYTSEIKVKPGVVILSANADVAGKMGSIVEIAKSKIQEEKGKWWQYTKLDSKVCGLKMKQAKRARGGKKLPERDNEPLEKRTSGDQASIETTDSSVKGQKDEEANDEAEEPFNETEDIEDDFEVMATTKVRSHKTPDGSKEGNKIRDTPIMIIFFAREPVPGLEDLYGCVIIRHFNVYLLTFHCSEQTNASNG